MLKYGFIISVLAAVLILAGCSQNDPLSTAAQSNPKSIPDVSTISAQQGASVANGWYEGEEIYYIDQGVEEGVAERGENDIYLIGGNRVLQAQVVLHIPGEPGYTPHWNAMLVSTAAGVTTQDILASSYASAHFPESLFDDVEDILGAKDAGLVTVTKLGVVVLCPIVSEKAADAPGNTALSEDFPRPWPDTF